MFAFLACTSAKYLQPSSTAVGNTHALILQPYNDMINLSFVATMKFKYIHNNMTLYTGTITTLSHVQNEYHAPQFTSKKNPDVKGYDFVFMLQGPWNIQTYPNVIQISIYVLQNTMRKHDFSTYLELLIHLKLMPFTDIFSIQFHSEQRIYLLQMSNHFPIPHGWRGESY